MTGYRAIIGVLLLVVAALFVAPLATVHFVTIDDTVAALDVRSGINLWDRAWEEARDWSRLQSAAFQLGMFVPHLPGNLFWYQVIKISSTLVAAAVFCLSMWHLTGVGRLGILCGLLFCTLTMDSWYHNLLNAFPFVFDVPFALSMAMLAAVVHYVRGGRFGWLVAGAAGYLIAVWIYEAFLPFFVLFGLVALVLPVVSEREAEKVLCRRRRLIGAAVPAGVAFLYLGAHVVFSQIVGESRLDGHYSEGELASTLPLRLFWRLSEGGMPLHQWIYFAMGRGSTSHTLRAEFVEHGGMFGHFLAHFRMTWLAKALLAGLIAWVCLSRPQRYPRLQTRWIVAVGALVIVLPNLIIALVKKYQLLLVEHDILSHTTSCYSQFGYYLILAILLLRVSRTLAYHGHLSWAIVWAGFWALSIGTMSLAVDYWNDHVHRDQDLAGKKWELLDHFADSEAFANIPKNGIVYAPSLWKGRGILGHYRGYWSDYFNATAASGSKRQVFEHYKDFLAAVEQSPKAKTYFARWHLNPEGWQYLVFGRLRPISGGYQPKDGDAPRLAIRKLSVFHQGMPRRIEVEGSAYPSPRDAVAEVVFDGIAGKVVTDGPFEFFIDSLTELGPDGDRWSLTLNCPTGIDPRTVSLQPADVDSQEEIIEFLGWEGTHKPEFIEADWASIRWTAGDASIRIRNNLPYAVTAAATTSLRANGARTAIIGLPGRTVVLEFAAGDDRKFLDRVSFVLPPGESVIPLTSDRPAAPASADDPRPLGLQFYPWNFDIIPQTVSTEAR